MCIDALAPPRLHLVFLQTIYKRKYDAVVAAGDGANTKLVGRKYHDNSGTVKEKTFVERYYSPKFLSVKLN